MKQEATIDFISELRGRGYRTIEDGSAVIVITGDGRESRAQRYESAQVAYDTLVTVPEVEAKRRALAEDSFARIEKSIAARDAFARR